MAKRWWVSEQGMKKNPNGADWGQTGYSYHFVSLQTPPKFLLSKGEPDVLLWSLPTSWGEPGWLQRTDRSLHALGGGPQASQPALLAPANAP